MQYQKQFLTQGKVLCCAASITFYTTGFCFAPVSRRSVGKSSFDSFIILGIRRNLRYFSSSLYQCRTWLPCSENMSTAGSGVIKRWTTPQMLTFNLICIARIFPCFILKIIQGFLSLLKDCVIILVFSFEKGKVSFHLRLLVYQFSACTWLEVYHCF